MNNKTTLDVLRQIDALFQQADKLWATLPGDEQNRLNGVHNEDGSLGHCIRWGLQACAELGEREASDGSSEKTDTRTYLERILATQPFIDVYKLFKADGSGDQLEDESDLDFVKRSAQQDCEDGLDEQVCPPMFPEVAADVVAGRPTPEPQFVKMVYLIVPAWSDQAGQCRIVSCDDSQSANALAHYRATPQDWKEVGLMNSQGKLVCLSASTDVYQEFKDCEPLMAGSVFTFDEKPSPTNIAVYDNEDATADRYTVVYLNQKETDTLYGARGMSEHPFHPQGVGMYCTATPGAHLGKMIRFEDLPPDCRKLVLNDLADDSTESDEPFVAPAPR